MTRTLPIILVLLLALGIFFADPARRAEPMISPARVLVAVRGLPVTIAGWQLVDQGDSLPRAYPPHYDVWEASARYGSDAPASGSTAYLRIVIAQDRRDLLAFDPTHAMRAGGWEPDVSVRPTETNGLWRTQHTRGAGLLDERVVLETAYVVPGRWGSDSRDLRILVDAGPGWPGPGAIVQMLVTAPVGPNAQAMRDVVKEMAQQLADELARTSTP